MLILASNEGRGLKYNSHPCSKCYRRANRLFTQKPHASQQTIIVIIIDGS